MPLPTQRWTAIHRLGVSLVSVIEWLCMHRFLPGIEGRLTLPSSVSCLLKLKENLLNKLLVERLLGCSPEDLLSMMEDWVRVGLLGAILLG